MMKKLYNIAVCTAIVAFTAGTALGQSSIDANVNVVANVEQALSFTSQDLNFGTVVQNTSETVSIGTSNDTGEQLGNVIISGSPGASITVSSNYYDSETITLENQGSSAATIDVTLEIKYDNTDNPSPESSDSDLTSQLTTASLSGTTGSFAIYVGGSISPTNSDDPGTYKPASPITLTVTYN